MLNITNKPVLLALLVAAAAAASCAKTMEPLAPAADAPAGLTFTGSIAQFAADTKTTLGDDDAVWWSAGDQVSINGVVYDVTPDADDPTKATFTKADETADDPVAPYRAFYPALPAGADDFVLPAVQTYSIDGITDSPLYAQSETTTLQFHNVCALLELNLCDSDVATRIQKVEVIADHPLHGACTTKVDNLGPNYYVELDGDSSQSMHKVTLDCGEGVELTEYSVPFRIAIPQYIKEDDDSGVSLLIKFTTTDGQVFEKKTKERVSVEAGNIYAFDWTPTFHPDYFYVTLPERKDRIVIHENEAPDSNELECSTDLENWYDIEYEQGFPGDECDYTGRVYIRAKTARTSAQTEDDYIWMESSTTGSYAVGGNIMYLLGPDGPSMELKGYDFYRMLYTPWGDHASSLADASALVLSAEKLAPYCYAQLFYHDQLVVPPELPATELDEYCYDRMFAQCELETAPVLNAKKMSYGCYRGMFDGCHLTQAPALPATELADECYLEMFSGCESLTEAPALPATELARSCYSRMFFTAGIKEPVVLPAKKLADMCYYGMFINCKDLASVTCLAEDFSGEYALVDWLAGTSAEGTFYKAAGITWPDGAIPAGWTVADYAPAATAE